MQSKINDTTETSLTAETKSAWHRPAISYIDIKRTMSTPGGSLSDSVLNSPGSSITSAV